MNNKYIDNKLKAFREKFKHSQFVDYSAIEQFIKEALELVEKQTREETLMLIKNGRNGRLKYLVDKLKSEQKECNCHCHHVNQYKPCNHVGLDLRSYECAHCQKPEEKRQEKVLCKDSEGNKCNEGIVDFQGNMVVVREGTLITLTHCFPQNGMFFGLKEAQFNKVRDYLSKMIGELLYTQASDDKEQTRDKKLTSYGKEEETKI